VRAKHHDRGVSEKRENVVVSMSAARKEKLLNLLKEERGVDELTLKSALLPQVRGFTWLCEYHLSFGFALDEDEAITMAGQHMWYIGEGAQNCEIFTRECE